MPWVVVEERELLSELKLVTFTKYGSIYYSIWRRRQRGGSLQHPISIKSLSLWLRSLVLNQPPAQVLTQISMCTYRHAVFPRPCTHLSMHPTVCTHNTSYIATTMCCAHALRAHVHGHSRQLVTASHVVYWSPLSQHVSQKYSGEGFSKAISGNSAILKC